MYSTVDAVPPHRAGRVPFLAAGALCLGAVAGQLAHRRVHPGAAVSPVFLGLALLLGVVGARRPPTLTAGREALLLLAVFAVAFGYLAAPH